MDENTVVPIEETGVTVMEELPTEVPAESLTDVQKLVVEDEAREEKRIRVVASMSQFHMPTPQHFRSKERGVGITRKNRSASKKARLQEKKSRRTNRRK